ncbi:MAG TPA: hypothetical protein VE912_16420 [Bacteroidales bacterium]|nr:hypothetical protein [Bacteroidales bacterium]
MSSHVLNLPENVAFMPVDYNLLLKCNFYLVSILITTKAVKCIDVRVYFNAGRIIGMERAF